MTENKPSLVLVINDLIFETKIRSTAQSLGIELQNIRSVSQLTQHLDASRSQLVIVDLNTCPDAVEVIRAANDHETRPRVLAFVSHVDTALADAAIRAGAGEVMPRSRFANELPDILRALATPSS